MNNRTSMESCERGRRPRGA